jgi:hypothetical protein
MRPGVASAYFVVGSGVEEEIGREEFRPEKGVSNRAFTRQIVYKGGKWDRALLGQL